MRYFFPYRQLPGGTLKLELQDTKPGTYEILSEKYFLSMTSARQEIEQKVGELRMADISLKVHDPDRKFRDTIFAPGGSVKFRALYEEKGAVQLGPKAIDLDGSTEYAHNSSSDFDMNGHEDVTNTGFETDTNGWTLNSSSARNNTQAHGGTWSLRDTGSGTPTYNEYDFGSNRLFQVTAEVWVWIDAAPPGGNATLQLLDASNNMVALRNANNGTVGAWQKLVLNVDTTLVRKIRLVNTTTITVYWDDVSLSRGFDFTIAAWMKAPAVAADHFILCHDRGTGLDNAWSFLRRSGTNTKINVSIGGPPVFVEFSSTAVVFDNSFHLVVAAFKRDGNLQVYVDGAQDASASITTVGRLDSSITNLVLGARSSFHDFKWAGLFGEVMIIKGWAADASAVADWHTNGMVARHDTIGFWRWQDPNNLGRDYSAKSNHLTMVNLDNNDVLRDSGGAYKQRAQANESLFYGIVDLDTSAKRQKKGLVEFTAFDAIKSLEDKSIAELYALIQSSGYEENKGIIYPFNRTLVVSGKGVKLVSILNALASLAGFSGARHTVGWFFKEYAGYASAGFDKLYVITKGNYIPTDPVQSMFDENLDRSPMSFHRFKNCLALLKHLQLMFFSFAFSSYRKGTDDYELFFKQRGAAGQRVTKMNGRLLDYDVEYQKTPGVLIKNLYGRVGGPPPAGDPALIRTLYGASGDDGFELELPLKTVEQPNEFQSNTYDDLYSYLHVALDFPGPEQVANGNFETDTTGWVLNSASSRSNTRAHNGSWSLRDGGSGSPAYNRYEINPFGTARYIYASVWVYIESYTSGTIKLEVLDPSVVNVFASFEANVGIVGAWQQLVLGADLGAFVRANQVRLHNTGTAVVYWDEVSYEIRTALPDTLYTCGSVITEGWPLQGSEQLYLHAALANSYGQAYVGVKPVHVRKFHRLTATKDGETSIEHARVLELEEFLDPSQPPGPDNELATLDIVSADFDATKNESTIKGIAR